MILEGCVTNYRGEKVYEDEKCRVESKREVQVWTTGRGKRERKQASAGTDIVDEKRRRLPRPKQARVELVDDCLMRIKRK